MVASFRPRSCTMVARFVWPFVALMGRERAFSFIIRGSIGRGHAPLVRATTSSSHGKEQPAWANWALLISSWSDGVAPSHQAKTFLKQGLSVALLSDKQRQAERAVEASVVQSPCCGPDLDSLRTMESVDRAIEVIKKSHDQIDASLQKYFGSSPCTIRFAYIPTAMYALRPDSTNTPGKQRQRARADGRKRRTEIVRTLKSLFDPNVLSVQVSTVTLDLDDSSVKQGEGFDVEMAIPKDGLAVLTDWAPHFVYVEGGNTFWLHHCLEKGGWREVLVSAITKTHGAVYCGKSAGAILAGASVDTATWKGWDDPRVVPDMENYDHWRNVRGLDVVGGKSVFPHMGEEWETLVEEKRNAMQGNDILCLTDDEVLCVDGSSMRTTQLSSVPMRS